MGISLRVLNVEDSEDDARLLLRHLSRAGYDVTLQRVDTPEALQVALDEGPWDVLITDYVLPQFSGPEAAAQSKARVPDLPVVLLSGVIRAEQLEAEALQAGARDFLLKTNLDRFVPAIALAAGVMTGQQRAEAHLALSHEYLRQPEPSLAKAMLHGSLAAEEAERLGETGASTLVRALIILGTCQLRSGKSAEAARVLHRLRMLQPHREPPLSSPSSDGALSDDWALHLEFAEYHLQLGDPVQAVHSATAALHLAQSDSARCFDCYMILCRCAWNQGQKKDALNFALSARIMALESQRHDLSFRATSLFLELLGSRAERDAELKQLEQEYRRWGLDIYRYLPEGIGGDEQH